MPSKLHLLKNKSIHQRKNLKEVLIMWCESLRILDPYSEILKSLLVEKEQIKKCSILKKLKIFRYLSKSCPHSSIG